MDSNNYVAPRGDKWIVVVGGQLKGEYNTQSEAENAYNSFTSGNQGPSGNQGSPGNPGPGGYWVDPATGYWVYPTVPPTYRDPATGRVWQAGHGDTGPILTQPSTSDPGPTVGSGGGTYQTVNGPKTVQQMRDELRIAGYPNWQNASEQEIVNVYASTTGGAVTGGGGGVTGGDYEWVNSEVEALKAQLAQQAAYQAYLNKKLELVDIPMAELEKDRLAFEAAQAAYSNALGIANLIAQLRGPRNAFQQQAVLHGLNEMGLSRAMDAIVGRVSLPSSGGDMAAPEPVSLQTIWEDLTGLKYGSTPIWPFQLRTGGQPGTTPGLPPGGGPGMYYTANGWRTVQQMRDELVKASGGMDYWKKAGDAEVISEYGKVTGKEVIPWQDQSGVAQAQPQPQPAPTVSAQAPSFQAPTGQQAQQTLQAAYQSYQQGLGNKLPETAPSVEWIGGKPGDSGEYGGINPIVGYYQGRAIRWAEWVQLGKPPLDARTARGAEPGPMVPYGGGVLVRQGGTTGSGETTSGLRVGPSQAPVDAYLASLPAPNKIVGRSWVKLPQSSQDFLLSAYEAKGYDPNDVLYKIKAGLPSFKAPTYGLIRG